MRWAAESEPPDRWRAIRESGKYRGKDVLLIVRVVFFFGFFFSLTNPVGFHKAAAE